MKKRQFSRTLMAIAVIGVCGVVAGGQEGKGLWGVKPLPWEVVQRKADFPILTPRASEGQYTLVKSEIAWVQKHEYTDKDHKIVRASSTPYRLSVLQNPG
jgi:hypothetical protein